MSAFLSYDSDFEFGEKRLSLRNKTNPALALSSITDQYNVLRPAGNVFTLKNEKILPTQDCSKYYGGAIIFNSINTDNGLSVIEKFRLTPEDIIREIGIKNCIGCHTYNFNDKIEVIDVVIRHFSFGGLFYKIKSKFSKLFKNRK